MPWTTGRDLPADWTTRRKHVLERDLNCRLRYPGRCAGTSTEVDQRNPGRDHSYENLQGVCFPLS